MTNEERRNHGAKTVWHMIAKTTSAQRSAAGKIGGRVATSIRWTCTTHGLTTSPCHMGNHRKKHADCLIVKPEKEIRPRAKMSDQGRANIAAGRRRRVEMNGRPPVAKEPRPKIRRKCKPMSAERRAKIAAAKLGVKRAPFSAETRAKMRESAIRRRAREREQGIRN